MEYRDKQDKNEDDAFHGKKRPVLGRFIAVRMGGDRWGIGFYSYSGTLINMVTDYQTQYEAFELSNKMNELAGIFQ